MGTTERLPTSQLSADDPSGLVARTQIGRCPAVKLPIAKRTTCGHSRRELASHAESHPLTAIYIIIGVLIGLCVDRATFGRLTMILGAFGQSGDEHLYRNTLFPRVVLSIVSSIAFVIGLRSEPQNFALVITAAAIFFMSSLYGVYLVMNGGGRE